MCPFEHFESECSNCGDPYCDRVKGGEKIELKSRSSFNNILPSHLIKKAKIAPEKWAKANKQMIEKEKAFVRGEISFEMFCVIYQAFDKYTGTGYCAKYDETVEEFNKRGLYHPFNKGELRSFEKRSLKVSEDEINRFIKNKERYSHKEVNGKLVWGIGRAAIVLVDEIIYDEEAYSKWSCKGKTFHNFNPKVKSKNKNSFGNGIEIMKKLINLYGE